MRISANNPGSAVHANGTGQRYNATGRDSPAAAGNEPAARDSQVAAARKLQQLRSRDREVRAHEQAHRAAGGDHVGPAQYDYRRGPDGRLYAVDGEVSADLGRAESPAATLEKMETLRRAALAPAEPSAQDRRVAAQAAVKAAAAAAELRAGGAVEGDYYERGRPDPSAAVLPPAVRAFAQVAAADRGELLSVGGRLDTFA
jgi:hypothetical protein